MEPYSLAHLHSSFTYFGSDFVLYLPRTADLRQVAKYAETGGKKLKVMHYCMHGASKALCVFFGDFEKVE
jgi:trimethylguanosine synthase